MPPAAALAVVQYPSDAGYYLLYLDVAGNEVTDTWHASLDDALSQAEFGDGHAQTAHGSMVGADARAALSRARGPARAAASAV